MTTMQFRKIVLALVLSLLVVETIAQQAVISSPDKSIKVIVKKSGQQVSYQVQRDGAMVIQPVPLLLLLRALTALRSSR